MRAKTFISPLFFMALGSIATYQLTNTNNHNLAPLEAENISLKMELDALNQEMNNENVSTTTNQNEDADYKKNNKYKEEIQVLASEIESLKKQLQAQKSAPFPSKQKTASIWSQGSSRPTLSNYQDIESEFSYGTSYTEEDEKIAQHLTLSIENTPNLSDFGFGDAECKNNTCRMQLAAPDDSQIASLFTALNSEFSSNSTFSNKSFLVVPDISTGLTSVYIGDENSELMTY